MMHILMLRFIGKLKRLVEKLRAIWGMCKRKEGDGNKCKGSHVTCLHAHALIKHFPKFIASVCRLCEIN